MKIEIDMPDQLWRKLAAYADIQAGGDVPTFVLMHMRRLVYPQAFDQEVVRKTMLMADGEKTKGE